MADMYNYIPSFFFKVVFNGLEDSERESRFHEVTGIGAELTFDKVEEGGQNRYIHYLPKRTDHANLVLHRAMSVTSSVITSWAENAIYNFDFKPCQIIVSLMKYVDKKDYVPVRSWVFEDAYAVKLQYSGLNAKESALLIETMELAYSYSRPLSLK